MNTSFNHRARPGQVKATRHVRASLRGHPSSISKRHGTNEGRPRRDARTGSLQIGYCVGTLCGNVAFCKQGAPALKLPLRDINADFGLKASSSLAVFEALNR